jgi:hypothetical protein
MPTTRSGRRTGPGRKSDRPHDDGNDESYDDEFDDGAADDEFDDGARNVTDEEDEPDGGPEPVEDLPANEAAKAALRYIADLTASHRLA